MSSEHKIFADDTSVIISSKKFDDFCAMANTVISHTNKGFNANKLAPKVDKTNIIKLTATKFPAVCFKSRYIKANLCL
jgi:hypothetical protein